MEFKRRPEAESWTLILKSKPYCPTTSHSEFVARFWRQVQALKRQADVPRAGVYLWVDDLSVRDFDRLVANTFGSVIPSFGEGFCGPAALSLALNKPLVAPRHTSLCDYLPDDYPYRFATRPVRMRFANDELYGVHSTWHIAEPYALANALSRLVTDPPSRREAACCAAKEQLSRCCRPERVRRLLIRELSRHASKADSCQLIAVSYL
jgi:glycosyltransferase involved in cell wall biosynthesis